MNDGSQSGQSVSNRPHAQENTEGRDTAASSSGRTSSVSSRSRPRSPSPSRAGSKTPLTPEESPPFRTTRKRTAAVVDEDDKELDNAGFSSAHAKQDTVDSGTHVCICQPDPKIPRPRNAFILYRQHHQANVVAQHPGLANPDISKIIGEQWQNQPPEVKNKWKALAEEEKIRHQQQYPTYRYQPKRSGRRNSLSSEGTGNGERARCTKCGGKSLLTPSTPYSGLHSSGLSPASGQHTPSSAITPVTRTLPVLRDLSLQSPAVRRMAKHFPGGNMSASHSAVSDDKDEIGPMSPDLKRRRFNADHPVSMGRSIPSRYAVAHAPSGAQIGPGTPFPFGQSPPHPYPPGAVHARRESLPGLRGVVGPPGTMAPPPRPGPGYQQHRLSQGHIAHDRSLTLPPLQTGATGNTAGSVTSAGLGKTAEEQILSMEFRRKVAILRRVAPPSSMKKPLLRGPLVAVEGDNAEAVAEVATWLSSTLGKGDDLTVDLLSGPKLLAEGSKETLMAQYHRLVAEWLSKSNDIREALSMKVESPTDSVMLDAATAESTKSKGREIDEHYDDSETSSSQGREMINADTGKSSKSVQMGSEATKMEVEATATVAGVSADTTSKPAAPGSSLSKPVSIIANYSLHASNFFACHVPIGSDDPYSPLDHWQWTASQWRGIIGPDLTIYVRDAVAGENGKQSVEIEEDGHLFVVKRTKAEGKAMVEVEGSTLRRLGFEVSEWVRAFGSAAAAE